MRLEEKHARSSLVVVREGELLLTGGFDHNCSLLSPRTGHWRDGPSMPTEERYQHCSAQLRGSSVLCGGWDSNANGALSSTLLLPAGDAAQWKRGCEMTTSRRNAGAAVVGAADASAHRMLVVGGADSINRSLDSCELYDAVADRWLLQETGLLLAMQCRAAPIGGGSAVLAVQCNDHAEKTRCALFDARSSSPSWQPMASPDSARRYHTIAAVGEHSVVMLGGRDADYETADIAQLYDTRTGRWSERSEWRLPAPSYGHCACLL